MLPLALGAYLTLCGVDLAQTAHCLGAGRCREANPIMAALQDRPAALGAVKLGLDSAAVVGIVRLHKDHPRLAWVVTTIGLAAETAATLHNARRATR